MRLFGEIVKDAESWISIGFMKHRKILMVTFIKNIRWIQTMSQSIVPLFKMVICADQLTEE
jgi:hypothetical protein